jgi:hypothetical protein
MTHDEIRQWMTLCEGYADTIEVGNRSWDIFRNPSRKEYIEALGSNGEVRAFLVGDDMIIWNAYGATHSTVRDRAKQLRLPHDTIIPLLIYGRPGRECIAVVTDHVQNTMWSHNGAVVAAIENNPYMRRVFPKKIEVSFYDQDIVGDWRELDDR